MGRWWGCTVPCEEMKKSVYRHVTCFPSYAYIPQLPPRVETLWTWSTQTSIYGEGCMWKMNRTIFRACICAFIVSQGTATQRTCGSGDVHSPACTVTLQACAQEPALAQYEMKFTNLQKSPTTIHVDVVLSQMIKPRGLHLDLKGRQVNALEPLNGAEVSSWSSYGAAVVIDPLELITTDWNGGAIVRLTFGPYSWPADWSNKVGYELVQLLIDTTTTMEVYANNAWHSLESKGYV